jgi:hypothetical protein
MAILITNEITIIGDFFAVKGITDDKFVNLYRIDRIQKFRVDITDQIVGIYFKNNYIVNICLAKYNFSKDEFEEFAQSIIKALSNYCYLTSEIKL